MPTVYRYKLMKDLWMDTGALPCPRCRNENPVVTSSMYTGTMVTCECGGRSHVIEWNNGEIQLHRNPGDAIFHYVGLKFARPTTDKVIKVKASKQAWALADAPQDNGPGVD